MLNEDEAIRLKKEKEKADRKRRERLNEILLIHPKARTKAIETELTELLAEFPCFHGVAEFNFDALIQISREIYMECLLPDTVVIRQDEEPEAAYLITQGRCLVYVTFRYRGRFDRILQKTKHMCSLGNRACFGELSLLFSGKRTATVKTMEASYVIVIPKHVFIKYIKEPMLRKLTGTIQFLKSFTFFDELDQNTLLILASKTVMQVVQTDTLITKQGKKSKYLYFIAKGRVKIMRMLTMLKPYKQILDLPDGLTLLYKDPTEQQMQIPGLTMTKIVELAELGKYQCFGDDFSVASNFLLSTQQIAMAHIRYASISTMPTECYCI